jgi:hypothetical protein
MNYFDNTGRRIPSKDMRVFGDQPSYYFRIVQPKFNYADILNRSKKYNGINNDFSVDAFKTRAEELLKKISNNKEYENLLKGVHIPFVYEFHSSENDLGRGLEEILLPNLKNSFTAMFPECHFKAILQSDSKLPEHISIDKDSKYNEFIDTSKKGIVVGWFFPQAMQEFDVDSQRLQMRDLPKTEDFKLCLSGGMDICSALIGSPDLLISDEYYAPVLCLSSYVHQDKRLVLLMKAYGPHMEFWCMTQMLTKDTTQVSEQWAGGLTIYG